MREYSFAMVLFFSLLGGTLPVYAESWFQVEVIVFEYTRPDTDEESWYANPGLPVYQYSIELIQGLPPVRAMKKGDKEDKATENGDSENGAAEGEEERSRPHRVAYLKLPEEHQNLGGVYRVLDVTSEYRPLYHAAWQQPGLDGTEARYVHIEGLRETTGSGVEIRGNTGGNAQEDDTDGETASIQSVAERSFDGMIRLRSTRFLHLDVDAAFFPHDPAVLQSEAALAQRLPVYRFADYVRLRESRRIRLKELHYFDHPLFGVIVQVTRIEEKESE